MSLQTSFEPSVIDHGTAAIRQGSQSFAAAAQLLSPSVREGVVMLYAWCRHCDDVVDGQQWGHGQTGSPAGGGERLAELRWATRRACEGQASTDPVFAGIAEVVRRFGLPMIYLEQHLDGFEMDVQGCRYQTFQDTLDYCWHVAGVVGVMMAHVMGSHDPATLDRACDLGIAFQLTNIARDIVEDAAFDRIYLPADWLVEQGLPTDASLAAPQHRQGLARVARRLVEAAEPYYESSVGGLADLPFRSAWSIATARGVYRAIGRKVTSRGAMAWDRRAATNRTEKTGWLILAAAQALGSRLRRPARGSELFRRPA